MKKQIIAVVMASLLAAIIPMSAVTASAQTRCNTNRSYRGSSREAGRYARNGNYDNGYDSRYNNAGYNDPYYNDGYYNGQNGPSAYDRHRKAANLAIGIGAGAAIGAMIGGRRGALIGAAAGAAGGALVTAKQRPRNYSRYF